MAGRANVRPAQSDPRIGGRLARARGKESGMPGDGEMVSLSEPLLDCVAAAALLNVRVSWVRDAARLGHLPCLRVGRHLRFTRAMLEDWLAAQAATTHAPAAGRASARTAGTPRPGFRRSTQAALLASLAEAPKAKGGERDE
jgi:excisionase family DNA binding protein